MLVIEFEQLSALGLTPASYVLEKYPEGQRAFHRLRCGAYSGCNMYALLTPDGVRGARAFATGGQFAKNPARLIAAPMPRDAPVTRATYRTFIARAATRTPLSAR